MPNKIPNFDALMAKFCEEELSGLLPKQVLFITEYIKDFNAMRASLASGYSKKNAQANGYRLVNSPEIKKAVDSFKALLAVESKYTLEKALAQNEELLEHSKTKGQMMAVTKFLEFKLKMTGHIQDRLTIDHNLKGNFILQLPNLPPPSYALPMRDVNESPDEPKLIESEDGTKKTK